jgi:ribosomal protein S18 acetylase RimI-like enzyme
MSYRPLKCKGTAAVARVHEIEHHGRLVGVDPPSIEIEAATPEDLLGELFDPVVRIWMAAMGRTPDHPRTQTFGAALESQVERDDFRSRVARKPGGRPVGFTYGYTGQPGQRWTDLVTTGMDEATRLRWTGGHFELAELHVHPSQQGRGIGGQLHDAVLHGLPHKTALLSTHRGPTPAFGFYRKRGWVTLIESFSFPEGNVDYRIMGLDLTRVA